MSYKSRVLLYVGLLLVLIVGMMSLSFRAARDVIDLSSRERLAYAALRKQDSLQAERDELLRYTALIAADARLRRHLEGRDAVDFSRAAIEDYFDEHFALLHADCRLAAAGEKLLRAGRCPGLVDELHRRRLLTGPEHFYFASPGGVMTVAVRPLALEDGAQATVAVGRVMDEQWLNRHERRSDAYLLFFERHGQMLWSSNPAFSDAAIDTTDAVAWRGESYFRLHRVELQDADRGTPQLWVAVSQNPLMHLLARYQRWLAVFTLLGASAVLLMGWLMLRNFQRPFQRLMHTTRAMMKGELPVIARSHPRTEMDLLVNRFADVLDVLRRQQAELRLVHRQLQETAITDSLTHLYNRRYLQEVSPGLFARAQREGRYVTAVLMDLDWFKEINDRHGHLGGDAVLAHFSRLLRHNSRASDQLFRVGGEEFLVLNLTDDPEESVTLANKLRVLLARSPARYQKTRIPITVSAGVSCCSGEVGGESLSQLLRMADKALYQAKAGGRNRVILHSSYRSALPRALDGVDVIGSRFAP
ncbi:MAG: GGDEF domain-containing protein [Gammaproteobacteria bacterium]|jgi:diguanylate cyclase (GGDEF)-like protein